MDYGDQVRRALQWIAKVRPQEASPPKLKKPERRKPILGRASTITIYRELAAAGIALGLVSLFVFVFYFYLVPLIFNVSQK
jgi:hypothetical protein